MSFTQALSSKQRGVADSIVVCICRGNYVKALLCLNSAAGTLPQAQEQSLHRMLQHLQLCKKLDPLIASEKLIKELQLPHLDASVISSMNTHIPRSVLVKIYEQMLELNFGQFQRQLQHLHWVEHTLVQHTLILYEHCTRLKAAQRTISKLQRLSGKQLELYALYALIFLLGIYLVSLLF